MKGHVEINLSVNCCAGKGEGEPGEHARPNGSPLQVRNIVFEIGPPRHDLFTRFLFRRGLL